MLDTDNPKSIDTAYRDALPEARGRGMSDLDLCKITSLCIGQCPILASGNSVWVKDPSIKAALKLATYINGEDKRRYGGLLQLTHALRSAHRVYNFASSGSFHQASIASAFVALMHDVVEDAFTQGRTAETDVIVYKLIAQCWKGDAALLPAIMRDIRSLTDSPGLPPEDRFWEQMMRASHTDSDDTNLSAVGMVVRFCEKLDTAEGDLLSAQDLPAIFTPDKIENSARVALRGFYLARAMATNPHMKQGPISSAEVELYGKVIEAMRQLAQQRLSSPYRPEEGVAPISYNNGVHLKLH